MLDERIFFKERAVNLTPSKFTPFSRQGYVNKVKKGDKLGHDKESFSSHRVLNYDQMEKQENIQKNIPISELKFIPKATPTSIKPPLICQTPISRGMEMYNYLSEKVKKYQNIPLTNNFLDDILTSVIQKSKK